MNKKVCKAGNNVCDDKKKVKQSYTGKYRVGIVQSISRGSLDTTPSVVFTSETVRKYFGEDVPLITTNNPEEIYNFIMKNTRRGIFRYNLQNNSAIIGQFIEFIYKIKCTSPIAWKILNKCIICCTYSNADIIRELNIKRETGLYFCLSAVSTILENFNGYEDKIYLIVSDSANPYYDQIYNIDNKPKSRVLELNSNLINDSIDRGVYKLLLALSTPQEYDKVISDVNQSKFEGEICIIELDYPGKIQQLSNKNIVVTTVSSGVGIIGETSLYPGLNEYLLYDTSSVVLCKNWHSWRCFIASGVMWNKTSADPTAVVRNNGNKTRSRKSIKIGVGTATKSVYVVDPESEPVIEEAAAE